MWHGLSRGLVQRAAYALDEPYSGSVYLPESCFSLNTYLQSLVLNEMEPKRRGHDSLLEIEI